MINGLISSTVSHCKLFSLRMKKMPVININAFFLGFAIAILTLFILYNGRIVTFLSDNKLLPMNEALTELYFEDYNRLPIAGKSGAPYAFRFTIHNMENKTMDYSYNVTQQSGSTNEIIRTGSLSLQNNELKTLESTFTLASGSARTRISVNLINKNQEIHFWVNNSK